MTEPAGILVAGAGPTGLALAFVISAGHSIRLHDLLARPGPPILAMQIPRSPALGTGS